MTDDEAVDQFYESGFLSEAVALGVPHIRDENPEWFDLADDLNRALQAACVHGMETVQGNLYDPKAVATRLIARACGTFQGAILLCERGMVTDGLTLTRSLLEDAFCMAAVLQHPGEFVDMLIADAEAARREQGKFLLAEKLFASSEPDTEERLRDAIDSIGKDPAFLSPKKVAKLGPLSKFYLAYQKLSNDAAHPSAASLYRHVARDKGMAHWSYRWGKGSKTELAFTLRQAIMAAGAIGIGYTQMLDAKKQNEAFAPILERVHALPEPDGSVLAASFVE